MRPEFALSCPVALQFLSFLATSDVILVMAVLIIDQLVWLQFGSDSNISRTTGCVALKFCTDIHASQRMNPHDFGDGLTCSCTMKMTFVVLSDTSEQLSDGLP